MGWSWWLVLFPVAVGCIALALMMSAVKLQAGGRKPRYRLTPLQNRCVGEGEEGDRVGMCEGVCECVCE